MQKKISAFSLIELTVVLIIVGILATIAIPQFQLIVEETRIKEAQSVLKTIRGAEKVFKAEHANYVGANISGAPAEKTAWWTLLKIQEVSDTADWSYGVEISCCNSGVGGWGSDPDNAACIPFTQRKGTGPNKDKYMYITMTTGATSNLNDSTVCTGIVCADQK